MTNAPTSCASLLDGVSMRATSRITGVAFNTVKIVLLQAGKVAAAYHDVHVRNVPAAHVQCDEVWSFVYAKAKQVAKMPTAPSDAGSNLGRGTALDADSKLIIAYLVGGRGMPYATTFLTGSECPSGSLLPTDHGRLCRLCGGDC